MTEETRRYLDEAATARLLDLSGRTLQRYRREGDGPPFIRAGARRMLYDLAEIERWAAGRTFAHRAAARPRKRASSPVRPNCWRVIERREAP